MENCLSGAGDLGAIERADIGTSADDVDRRKCVCLSSLVALA